MVVQVLGDGGVIEAKGAGAAAVRVENEVPEDLYAAMKAFLAAHPDWSQPRLMQAALSGFLFQQGCKEPGVLRHYLDGLFRRPEGALASAATPIAAPVADVRLGIWGVTRPDVCVSRGELAAVLLAEEERVTSLKRDAGA